MSSDQQEGAPASEQGPIERVVEGALGGMAAVAESLMEHVPGTAEHAIRRHLEEHGDMNVETGEPLPRDAGKARHAAADKPADPIMQHTVQAKAPGLDAPHPPEPGAHEVKVPSLKTADDLAFGGGK